MLPYFSIILPIYNVAPYLRRCVHSVLDQKFQDYELILVDDGSTDESAEICDKFALQYEHIHVIHKQNGGLSSARNSGLEVARGHFVWWVDSDDWIENDALSILYQATFENAPDMVKFNYIRSDRQMAVVNSNAAPGYYSGEENMEMLRNKAFFTAGEFGLSAWTHIYSRAFLRRHNLSFVSERIVGSEDYLFNLQALLQADKICVIADSLYYYEQRMGSLTQGYKKGLPEKYTELFIQLREYYGQMGALDEYEDRISCFYVWHLLHGTCIPNEYRVSAEHSMAEGRKHIYDFLGTDEFRMAIQHCDRSWFSRKQRIQLWAMRQRIELLFYWLFVRKPKWRKDILDEN